MPRQFSQEQILTCLYKYFMLRENPSGCTLGFQEYLKFSSDNGMSSSLLYMCEVGTALERLSKDEKYAVLQYFWSWMTYTTAVAQIGVAINGSIKKGAPIRQAGRKDRLVRLYDKYAKKAEDAMHKLDNNQAFKRGVNRLGFEFARKFSKIPKI